MKARDVVAGWPRGRSTAAWCCWDYPRQWLFNPYTPAGVQFIDVFGNWIDGEEYLRLKNQFVEDLLNEQQEFRTNRAYHASQQRMVDRWRRYEARRAALHPALHFLLDLERPTA